MPLRPPGAPRHHQRQGRQGPDNLERAGHTGAGDDGGRRPESRTLPQRDPPSGRPQRDIALIRSATPYEQPHDNYFFGARQQEGRLNYTEEDEDYQAIQAAAEAGVPTVLSVYMPRPAILTEVQDQVQAILVNFGITDGALLDVLTGEAQPEGRLPIALPSSMEAVEAQAPDLPNDSEDPLYPLHAGMTY